MRKPIILDAKLVDSIKSMSIYRVSDAPPDWAEEDPTQPDYIKNKPNLVAGNNIILTRDGNTITISAVGGINPDVPEEPEQPDIPDDPDVPSEDGTIIDNIISNKITVYLIHDGVEEEIPFEQLKNEVDYKKEGFYVISENNLIESAGYQVTFNAAENDIPQSILIPKDVNIINSYQYVPNLGQWLEKGFDETYWIADGEVTRVQNNVEITYVKYVFNSELWGDPIMTTEYWRFEMEV